MPEKQIEIYDGPGYTVVYNQLIQDSRLRLQTRAVLILMLSKPPEWDFSIRGMAAIAGVAKDTMSKMFAELMEAGYLRKKEQPHDDGGKFCKAGYIVAGQPVFADGAPCPNLPDTVAPDTVNQDPDQVIKEQVSNKQDYIPPYNPPTGDRALVEDKPQKRTKSVPKWKPERFEAFWKYYPRGEDRAGAVRQWDRLKPSDDLIETMARALKRQKATKDWQNDIGIPYACRWLRDRRWEDEISAEKPKEKPKPRREVMPEW